MTLCFAQGGGLLTKALAVGHHSDTHSITHLNSWVNTFFKTSWAYFLTIVKNFTTFAILPIIFGSQPIIVCHRIATPQLSNFPNIQRPQSRHLYLCLRPTWVKNQPRGAMCADLHDTHPLDPSAMFRFGWFFIHGRNRI